MDCNSARLFLELAGLRTRELDAADAELLEAHLAECPECGPLARDDRRADAHLATAIQAIPVPAGLRDRLHARLRVERAACTRRRRLRVYGPMAAAAAVLLVASVWWVMRPLPAPSIAHIHAEPLPRRVDEVEQRFAERDVRTAAPLGFNYSLLVAVNLVEFQGRAGVPHLSFVRKDQFAEVLILSARHFDKAALLQQGRVDSGGFTVEVRESHDEQFFYLIKYTGGSLQLFLTEEGRTTT